ncbi:MAG: hypothetical protein E7409_01635 [Ruminococcaceae bacterium]|nr:hypothetical protein [Oscillospiraceae bacterium]
MKKILSAILVMTVLFSSLAGVMVVGAASTIPIDEQFSYTADVENPTTTAPFNGGDGVTWTVLTPDSAGYPEGGDGNVLKLTSAADAASTEFEYAVSRVSNEVVSLELRFWWGAEKNFDFGFGNNRGRLRLDGTTDEFYGGHSKGTSFRISSGWHQFKLLSIPNPANGNVYDSFAAYKWDGTKYVYQSTYTPQYTSSDQTKMEKLMFNVAAGQTVYVDWMKINRAYNAPTNLSWNGKTLTWEATGGNITGYEISLYKNGSLVNTYTATDKSYDFSNIITMPGSYTAKVVTKGTYATDSHLSAASPACVIDNYPYADEFTAYTTDSAYTGAPAPFSGGTSNTWTVLTPSSAGYPEGATGNVMKITGTDANSMFYYSLPGDINVNNCASFEMRVYWPKQGDFRLGFSNHHSYVNFFHLYGSADTNMGTGVFASNTINAGWHQFKFVATPSPSSSQPDVTVYSTYEVYKWDGEKYVLAKSGLAPRYTTHDQTIINKLQMSVADTLYIDWIKANGYTRITPATPNAPAVNGATVSWTAVANAEAYKVNLYKGEEIIHSYHVTDGTSVNASEVVSAFLADSTATYTATVTAFATDTYGAESEKSAAFNLNAQDYKRVAKVIDFEDAEVGTSLAGTNANHTAVVVNEANSNGGGRGNVLAINTSVAGSPFSLLAGTGIALPRTEAHSFSVKADIYIPQGATADTELIYTGHAAGNRLGQFIAKRENHETYPGTLMFYANSNTSDFGGTPICISGWHTFEVIFTKDASTGKYATGEYYFDGVKLDTLDKPTVRHTDGSAFTDLSINGTGIMIDNIILSDYGVEERTVLAQPTNVSFADGELSFAGADAVHTAYLYRGGKIYSTKTLPAGTTEVDFSAEIAAGGTRALYRAGVCAKGNWTTTANSAEVVAPETMHGEGYPYEFAKYVMKNGNKLTVRGTVTRINNNEGTNLALLLPVYDGEKLAGIDIKDIDAETLAALGAGEILSLTVDLADFTAPAVKMMTVESVTNPIPLNAIEPITIPQ